VQVRSLIARRRSGFLIVCPRLVRGISPLSAARPVRDGQASALLPGYGGDYSSVILRVLKDGLISIVACCLSSAAGRGNTGL
jgi:hypothetical protein